MVRLDRAPRSVDTVGRNRGRVGMDEDLELICWVDDVVIDGHPPKSRD